MRIHRFLPTCSLALAALLAAPASAHEEHHRDPGTRPDSMHGDMDTRPEWKGDRAADHHGSYSVDSRARDEWLADCRRRSSDNGLGGAVIGGVAGGLLGNRIAGRGDRTIGTIAGAAAGALAGAAIDKSEDRSRTRDRCEAYLDDYYAQYDRGYGRGHAGGGHGGYGYAAMAYGYAVPMMMVPVMQPAQQNCTETVTYEYVDVPVRRRHIPRAPARRAPDKRLPMK